MPNRNAPVIYVSIVQQGHTAKQRLDVSDTVPQLDFDDNEKEAQKLQLSVNNFDLSNFDTPIWRKGTMLEASWGYVGDTTPTYSLVVQKVMGFTTLTVEAHALSVLMHKTKKNRKWTNVKRSDVVAEVAAANGYTSDQLHLDDTGVILPYVYQARETDAELLSRLARAEGYRFSVDYDGLHFHERKLAQAPLREYEWFGGAGAGDILATPSIENDVTAKPAQVVAKGRDPIAKTGWQVEATNESTPRAGLAEAIEIVDPASGQKTFQLGTGQATLEPASDLSQAAALRRVQGVFKDAQMTTVLMKLPVVGDPRVRARSIVTVKGMRSLSGNYYVTAAKDTVSTSGFLQTLSLRRDGRSEIYPKAAASAASVNSQEKKPDTGGLEPLEQVNPITGATETVFVDSRGRQQAGD
jgi:phage protein D